MKEAKETIAETASVLAAVPEKLSAENTAPAVPDPVSAVEKPVVAPVEKPVIVPVQNPPVSAPRKVTVEHIVKSGDSLGKIARRYYGAATKYGPIMKANNLTERSVLRIGQKLIVPDVESGRAGGQR